MRAAENYLPYKKEEKKEARREQGSNNTLQSRVLILLLSFVVSLTSLVINAPTLAVRE
jgi:hypothetical protein